MSKETNKETNKTANDKYDDYPTTGHEWDGIREYDKPMPRWWLITFYLCIVYAFGYMIAYPAIPLLTHATPGLLGYSSRGEVAKDIARVNAENAGITEKLLATSLDEINDDPDLSRFATAGGGAVFRTNCAQCHGEGAQGSKGYPNLQDDDWLWGGDLTAISATVTDGVRDETVDDTRFSQMPEFGDILSHEEIASAAEYVLSVSKQDHDAKLATAGKVIFEDNCASCHGDQAMGDREQGAPDLTDAIWLYGGDRETITKSITDSRFGVMPAWHERLTKAQIKQVTYYIHQLGGGE